MNYDIGFQDTFRYKNVVYVSVPKCASTYIRNLIQQIPFDKIDFSQIRRDDKIFTFIQNPRVRHINGIEQKIHQAKAYHLMKDKYFLNFLNGVAIGDDNTIPYHIRFKGVTKQTLFLPCDSEKYSVTELLKHYLKVHCPTIDYEKIDYDVDRNSSAFYSHNQIPDLRTRTRKFLAKNLQIDKGMFAMIYDEDFKIWKKALEMVERNLDQYLVSIY